MPKLSPRARITVGSAEFKTRCLELVEHVKQSRTECIVTRHGRPVARLVPVEPEGSVSPFGSMKGTVLEYEGPFDPVPAIWSIDEDEQG